jgi:hypothetical protein
MVVGVCEWCGRQSEPGRCSCSRCRKRRARGLNPAAPVQEKRPKEKPWHHLVGAALALADCDAEDDAAWRLVADMLRKRAIDYTLSLCEPAPAAPEAVEDHRAAG